MKKKEGKNQAVLVLIKPDGLKKSLTGNILSRLSEARLEIIGAKVVCPSVELAEKHYGHLKGQPFYPELIKYICGKLHGKKYRRVFALVYWGEDAIHKLRLIAGDTNPEKAEPTTIRGAYGRILTSGLFENVIHCSSDEKEAKREIQLWFEPEEIVYNIYPTKVITIKNHKKKVWETGTQG